MLELFTVGIKGNGELSLEINEELLEIANEEDLINTISEMDMQIIYNIANKIAECMEGE